MGAQYSHRCGKCGYSFVTSGPWEFYRTQSGRIKPYGHPVPISAEAARRGVYGLMATVYCPKCDRVVDAILAEFKQQIKEPDNVWIGSHEPRDEYKTGELPACPHCGAKELILSDAPDQRRRCPRCKTGFISTQMDWIS